MKREFVEALREQKLIAEDAVIEAGAREDWTRSNQTDEQFDLLFQEFQLLNNLYEFALQNRNLP